MMRESHAVEIVGGATTGYGARLRFRGRQHLLPQIQRDPELQRWQMMANLFVCTNPGWGKSKRIMIATPVVSRQRSYGLDGLCRHDRVSLDSEGALRPWC